MKPILQDTDSSQYWDLTSRIERLERFAPEPAHLVGASGEPAFEAGYANYAPGPPPTWTLAQFYKSHGIVRLAGLVFTSTHTPAGSDTIFTLPTGYRPAVQEMFITWSNIGASRLDVATSGAVINRSTGGGQSGALQASSFFISISGISFRAA